MNERDVESAERTRSLLERGRHDPEAFRASLRSVAPAARDGWLDRVLGLAELPDDGPDLPRDCVPYLPCSVDAVLRMVDRAAVRSSDVFVDIGSGLGRTAALVHLLTGAAAIGVEIQRALVQSSRELAARLLGSRVTIVEGDATTLAGSLTTGTVFFFYCPFSGQRLAKVLADLEPIARTRALRVCSVDLPLPALPWLTLETPPSADLVVATARR